MLSVVTALLIAFATEAFAEEPWLRHTIDNSSRGADGVRLADLDRDGREDIVTAWEEGGRIRICFQPTRDQLKRPWPSIQVGQVKSPEDAVFVDVNEDGWLDVVSCCEGKQKTVFFHMSPGGTQATVRSSRKWKTQPLPGSRGLTNWMFCEPLQDTNSKWDSLIIGSKDPNATIAQVRVTGRKGGSFSDREIVSLRDSGWIMSLRRFDVDQDGDFDIVYSDRKGDHRGVGWLECRSPSDSKSWVDHAIGGSDHEVMFLDVAAIGGKSVILCNTKDQGVLKLTPREEVTKAWRSEMIFRPAGVGSGKGVAIGDNNNDGHWDIACSCEHSEGKVGVFWLEQSRDEDDHSPNKWVFHDISGISSGVKFDRIELRDLDTDGDLDLITCEERDNLGVFWYENPSESQR